MYSDEMLLILGGRQTYHDRLKPSSLAALSLSDFWLFDHTRNYVFTYSLFALAR